MRVPRKDDPARDSLRMASPVPVRNVPGMPNEEPSVWEVRLGVYATQQQAEEVKERITRLLCPDPDHAPPCAIPWSVSVVPDADSYPELVEQARLETHRTVP